MYPASALFGRSNIPPYIKFKMTHISTWVMLQNRKRKITANKDVQIKLFAFYKQKMIQKVEVPTHRTKKQIMERKWE